MADLSWITSRLAVGGAVESLRDAREIQALGVTHVINLRAGDKHPEHVTDEVALWHQIKMEYLLDPTHDDRKPKDAGWFGRAIEYALRVLLVPGGRLLVHCKDGVHRSPAIAYAIVRAFGDFSDDAWAEIKKARPEAQPTYRKDADRAVRALGYAG